MIHPRTVVRLTLVVCECGFQLGYEILKAQEAQPIDDGRTSPKFDYDFKQHKSLGWEI